MEKSLLTRIQNFAQYPLAPNMLKPYCLLWVMWMMWIMLGFLTSLSACNDDFVPLKNAYPRLSLPAKHVYTDFDSLGFPYSFQRPVYSQISMDTAADPGIADAKFWTNLEFPSLNATVHLTYKPLGKYYNLDQLIYESFKLTGKQVYKATAIQQREFTTPLGYNGVFFRVAGNAATAHQFFITDQRKHFLRGALYFNTRPNEDSLRKAIDFVFVDIEKLVNSTRFR